MKNLRLFVGAAAMAVIGSLSVYAVDEPASQTIRIGDKDYNAVLLEKRDIGPGTTWRRIRVEGYPLNVNLVTMDMTSGYNRVETFQGQDIVGRTESIVTAANRLSSPGHQAVAAANGNFWCVATQEPHSDLLIGTTYGGNMRNSVIITETNNASDMWCGTPLQTCVIGAAADRLWIEPLVWRGYIAHEKTGYLDYQQVNKVVRDNEIGLYNTYYSSTKSFQPVDQYTGSDGKQHFNVVDGVSTEVYLKIADGSTWTTGQEFEAVVTDVRANAGRGTRGQADIVLVGRGAANASLANLAAGDVVRIYSGWTSFETWETPRLENLMQGLALILNNGETDPVTNQQNSYNNQVYPKTIYGTDKTNTMLYMMTIDKSTDPVWGASAGCPSWVACDILKAYGCWRAAAVDAGGSTEMFVKDRIVNKTTESNPRAVANGWMIFNTAPEDNAIARLAFDDVALRVPVHASPSPKILGYNRYGTLIDEDVQGVTFSCSDGIGTCTDGVFTAASTPGTGTLTAHLGDVSVDKAIEVVNADVALRLKEIIIDHTRRYPIEVRALVEKETFAYHPSVLTWTVADNTVADIDGQGTLTGLENGTTGITGTLGQYTDAAQVSVEIPDAPERDLALPEALTTKVTGVKVSKLDRTETGFGVDFNISSTRGTKLTVSGDARIYGLADAIVLSVNPGKTNVKDIIISLQTPLAERPVTVTKPVSLKADEDNEVVFDLKEFGDTDDLGFYPAVFKSLAFSLGGPTGAYHIDVPTLRARYNNYRTGVDNIQVDAPDAPDAAPEYYTIQGVRVSTSTTDLAPGLYIERRGNQARKILVR